MSGAPSTATPLVEPRLFDQVPSGCWVACIAGLTDIPHEELAALVPADFEAAVKDSSYHNAVNRLTRSRGWRLAYLGIDVPRGYAMAYGATQRGTQHAVIVKDGVLWHDPHPSRAGLVTVSGYEIIVPLAAPAVLEPA